MFGTIFRKNKSVSNKAAQAVQMQRFSKDLNKNIKYIQQVLSKCCDLESRPIRIGRNRQINARIFFIDGMVDAAFMATNILEPLMLLEPGDDCGLEIHEEIFNSLLPAGTVTIEQSPNMLVTRLLSGGIAIVVEGQEKAFAVEAIGWQERAVEESQTETVVKGARAGFVENIRVNRSLIRRMIKYPGLKFERLTVGRITNTEVNIAYIEGIVMEGLVEKVKERIERIDIDGTANFGMLQEMIDDSTFSVFSQSYSTERPDRACSCLLEGRVLIIMDNFPFVTVVPSVITQFFQSAEDYSTKYLIASFVRLLRFIGLNITVLLPGLYVAIFSYHHEMIPTELLKSISQAREQLPFPIFLEMLVLEISFEILREAGVRLPRPVGQAVSIVGALVIGQAAVAARLVSPPSIIIVALTAIASFTIPIPEGSDAHRLLRFPVLLAAGAFGLPGIITAWLMLLVHLSGLRSFGVPYLSPVSPFSLSDWKDFLIRVPSSFMKTRPIQTGKSNIRRQDNGKQGGK
ncbi:MAG: spore germination protein [Clostridiales bacterium]|nr:spore germination protein [Clostridiales bacterium]